jgi:hypothetical protein
MAHDAADSTDSTGTVYAQLGTWASGLGGTWSGTRTVKRLFGAGLLLVLVGVTITAALWPSGPVAYPDGSITEESGNLVWALVGAGFATVGQLLWLIAAIACGVRIGNRPDVDRPASAPE